ncbi:hypothetical protein GA0061103_0727, partial [Rhizobium multihospitium]
SGDGADGAIVLQGDSPKDGEAAFCSCWEERAVPLFSRLKERCRRCQRKCASICRAPAPWRCGYSQDDAIVTRPGGNRSPAGSVPQAETRGRRCDVPMMTPTVQDWRLRQTSRTSAAMIALIYFAHTAFSLYKAINVTDTPSRKGIRRGLSGKLPLILQRHGAGQAYRRTYAFFWKDGRET